MPTGLCGLYVYHVCGRTDIASSMLPTITAQCACAMNRSLPLQSIRYDYACVQVLQAEGDLEQQFKSWFTTQGLGAEAERTLLYFPAAAGHTPCTMPLANTSLVRHSLLAGRVLWYVFPAAAYSHMTRLQLPQPAEVTSGGCTRHFSICEFVVSY